jgi:hypothetical protein
MVSGAYWYSEIVTNTVFSAGGGGGGGAGGGGLEDVMPDPQAAMVVRNRP